MTFLLVPTVIAITTGFLTRYRERFLDSSDTNDHLNLAVSQLSRSNVMLQESAFHAAQQSRDSERHRIAREIHDTVGYTLTNLIMMMEAATDLVFDQPEELQAMMQAARDQAKSGLEETRRSLRALRAQEDPPIQGLAAIEQLVSTYDALGSVVVNAEYGNAPMTFGEDIDSVVFHFVQEGLTNALRHGKATSIRLRLWVEDDTLEATIRDNGRGSQTITEGIGFAGMRERISRYHGSIRAGNVTDGFQASMHLPIGRKVTH